MKHHRRTFEEYIKGCKEDGFTDREISFILKGMKLAFVTASEITPEESLSCADVAFEMQKQLDPQAVTWEKIAADTTCDCEEDHD